MEKNKPKCLGKVIPVDDASKLNTFMNHKYPSFLKIYDSIKDNMENINDISRVEAYEHEPNPEFGMRIHADKELINNIRENNPTIEGNDDVLTTR